MDKIQEFIEELQHHAYDSPMIEIEYVIDKLHEIADSYNHEVKFNGKTEKETDRNTKK